jgi:PKD repeat protein
MKTSLIRSIGIWLLLVLTAILPEKAAAQLQQKGCAGMANFEFKVECNTLIAWGKPTTQRTCPKYIWSFGNGTGGHGQQISYKYAQPGNYTVCLRVVDSCLGCDTTICKKVEIKGCNNTACQLKPDFSFKVDCRNVVFEASSNLSNTTYSWTFGDGGSGNTKAVKRGYLKDGEYTVCLTATWVDPSTQKVCKETVCKKVVIRCHRQEPCEIKGDFTFKQSGGTLGFSASSNHGQRYVWDFGDGTTGTGQHQQHSYKKPGTYTVCVTIYAKDSRCFVKICKKVIVKEPCRLSGGFYFTPVSGSPGTLKFIGQASAKNATYTWSFGDGTSGTGKTPQKTYSRPGTYEVCVTIRAEKCEVRICRKVVVPGQTTGCQIPKEFGYSISNSNCLTYTFEAPLRNCVKYQWTMGGHTLNSRFAQFTFAKAGTYQVCLKVIDTCNRCDTIICKTIEVKPCAKKCEMGIAVTWPSTLNECTDGTFSVRYTDQTTPGCRKVGWNWGDNSNSTYDMTATHRFKKGTYRVCVKIIDSCTGCDTTICKEYNVSACSSKCGLSGVNFSYRIDCNKIFFEGNNQSCASYSWSLGNGTSATGKTPTGTYATGKSYTVCLKVTDTCNKCDTLVCKTIQVPACNPCQIAAMFSVDSIVKGRVYLTNKSSSNAVWYSWSFGDSSFSSDKTPKKTYASTGTYKICLKVWDQNKNCSAEYCTTVKISSLRSGGLPGLQQGENEDVKVYPIPAGNLLQIDWTNSQASGQLELTDMNGRQVITRSIQAGEQSTALPVDKLPEGLYMLRLQRGTVNRQERVQILR